MLCSPLIFFFFFFNDTATTEIYTLSLHDALPISQAPQAKSFGLIPGLNERSPSPISPLRTNRSEEHTSELQSQSNLVCRLLLEKKKKIKYHKRKTKNKPTQIHNCIATQLMKNRDE